MECIKAYDQFHIHLKISVKEQFKKKVYSNRDKNASINGNKNKRHITVFGIIFVIFRSFPICFDFFKVVDNFSIRTTIHSYIFARYKLMEGWIFEYLFNFHHLAELVGVWSKSNFSDRIFSTHTKFELDNMKTMIVKIYRVNSLHRNSENSFR